MVKSKYLHKKKTWAQIKSLASTSTPMDYELRPDDAYQVFVISGSTKFFINLYPTTHRFVKGMSASNDADYTDFENNYKASIDAAPPAEQLVLSHKKTADDRIRVAIEKSDATAIDVYTQNWTDKTTWYYDSARIVDEVATDSGDQITYNLANNYIIDTYHGKITQEDTLLDSGGNSYRVEVKVNDVVKTEQDPHLGTGGDYTIDYDNGDVIFNSALSGGDVVKVTYHYAQTSLFKIVPDTGKTLTIEIAEVQFSADIVVTDSVLFETWGLVDVFAPQLMPGIPSGTQIKIKTFTYKTMNDYHNAAFKSYPQYPALGGNNWRGQQQPTTVFDWDYQRGLTLHDAYGMEVRILLEHDVPFGGTYATATLYCGEGG